MMSKNKKLSEASFLRQKAEEQLSRKRAEREYNLSEADVLKLIHELEVHQIELEMQNEELLLAEEQARAASEKFIALYDFSPTGYFTLDRTGVICEMNLTGANMLGKPRSVLTNRNFHPFVSQDTQPIFDYFLRKVFDSNTKQSCQVRLTLDGKPSIYVRMEGILSEDDQHCLVTVADVTMTKQAEQKLLHSEIRYRRLFESAKDGILIMDADSGKIVDVNPFLMEMLGYSHKELSGKELREIGIFKNVEESKTAFTELQNKGYIRFENMPLQTKAGHPINVEFVSNVYKVNQTKVIQCNIRDITERRIAEEALKESEAELRHLNAAKDKFFSIISHDLRSPFNNIMGLCDILAIQIKKRDYQGIENYAEILQKSAGRAVDLLNNLIEWSRSQSGRMAFNPSHIDLVPLINKEIEFLSDASILKSLTISTELPGELIVFADKAMISTVLRNLISNAIKFTKPGGTVIVVAKQNEEKIKVSVSDSGIGIDKDAREKLFLIEESHSTMGTHKEKGTGLGLLLCKEFVKKNGGKIWVESEPNKGSKFHFTLDARQRKSDA